MATIAIEIPDDLSEQLTQSSSMTEIIFLVEDDPEGGYVARALGESIFTQADSIPELRELVKDAVHCHYPDEATRPKLIRLHLLLAFIKGHGLTTAAPLH